MPGLVPGIHDLAHEERRRWPDQARHDGGEAAYTASPLPLAGEGAEDGNVRGGRGDLEATHENPTHTGLLALAKLPPARRPRADGLDLHRERLSQAHRHGRLHHEPDEPARALRERARLDRRR